MVELELGNNLMARDPEALGALAALQELRLDNNRLTHVARASGARGARGVGNIATPQQSTHRRYEPFGGAGAAHGADAVEP